MENLVRIGDRLINLRYVITIEPDIARGPDAMAVRMIQGHNVFLDGPDGKSTKNLVRSFAVIPPDLTPDDATSGSPEGDDLGYAHEDKDSSPQEPRVWRSTSP